MENRHHPDRLRMNLKDQDQSLIMAWQSGNIEALHTNVRCATDIRTNGRTP